MKKVPKAGSLLILLLGIILMMPCFSVRSLASGADNTPEPLVVGVPLGRCPVFYTDPASGQIIGIGVDYMSAAARGAGYDPVFVAITEETLKDALDNPEYDVLIPFGSNIPSAAGKPSIVSDELTKTPLTLVTLKSRQLTSTHNIHVGMLSSMAGVAETISALYPDVEVSFYESIPECITALRNHEVDGLLHNAYVWTYILQKPSYSDLMIQPSTMISMSFMAGTLDTPKGHEIIDRLNDGIAAMTDTQKQAIILDYSTRRLYRYDIGDYLFEYGVFLLLGLFILAAVAGILVLRWREYCKKQDEKMQQIIDTDSLTGVYSLSGFVKKAEEILIEHPEIQFYLSYNNIRDFKYINDRFGTQAGDELLRFWADASKDLLTEVEVMGRLEGDHFAVLRSVGGNEKIIMDEQKVLNPVRNYFSDRGEDYRVQLTSGVYVVMPDDYRDPDVAHMLDFARLAEKKVRDTNKDGYCFYNPDQWEKGKRNADFVAYMPTALKAGELQVWYQPQVDANTGKVSGAEALCRWENDKFGWIPPSEFIPAMEASGLIYDMDCYVWEKVCQDLKRWNEKGIHNRVSVNLSRFDILKNRNIANHFRDLIQKYRLSLDQISIEITETAYVQNSALLIQTTRMLRQDGFRVEMDDFGSGYSSLNMLKEVTVDRLKLDLRFLTGGDVEKGRVIISYMIQMAKALGMEMIAEGVETVQQADFLKSMGCSEMQGYYFYKPMSVEEYEKLMESGT